MADNIYGRRFVERENLIYGGRFVERENLRTGPAWHRLGEVVTEPMTATQIVKRARADYRVSVEPLEAVVNGAGLFLDDYVAIVREALPDDPTPRVFTVQGADWTPVQNLDVAAMLDPLTEEWHTETCGVLGHGEQMFLTLKIGTGEIAGDAMEDYLLVRNAFDGKTAITAAIVPVRVVCQNTLNAGLRVASVNVSMKHHKAVRDELAWRVDLIAAARGARTRVYDALGDLVRKRLVAEQVAEVLAATYPDPTKPQKAGLLDELHQMHGAGVVNLDTATIDALKKVAHNHGLAVGRAAQRRAQATTLYERLNDEHTANGGTAWSLFNAVVELADFRDAGRGENAAESAMFGARASEKVRAFAALQAV